MIRSITYDTHSLVIGAGWLTVWVYACVVWQELDVVKEATIEDFPAAQYLIGAPALPATGTPVNREKFNTKVCCGGVFFIRLHCSREANGVYYVCLCGVVAGI